MSYVELPNYDDHSWIDTDGFGSDWWANFDGLPGGSSLEGLNLDDQAWDPGWGQGDDDSLLAQIGNFLGGVPTGNATADAISKIIANGVGIGTTVLGARNALRAADDNSATARATIDLTRDKAANDWTSGILGNFTGYTDKMSGLTNEALKMDILRDYITNRNVKQEWMANKMFEGGGSAIPSQVMGGLGAMKSSMDTLFGNLDTAKDDYLGYRNDYNLVRNNVLPGMTYGQRTNPLALLGRSAVVPTPSANELAVSPVTSQTGQMIGQPFNPVTSSQPAMKSFAPNLFSMFR